MKCGLLLLNSKNKLVVDLHLKVMPRIHRRPINLVVTWVAEHELGKMAQVRKGHALRKLRVAR